MKLSNIVASALLVVGLAACVTTTPPHNMTVDSVRALNVQRVDVAVDPAARIRWMEVSVDLVDVKTGSPVLSYPKTLLTTEGGSKFNWGTTGSFSHDPVERMLAGLDGQLSSWLLKT